MNTLFFTKQDIEKVLIPSLANKTVEKAFKAYGLGLADMPPKSYLNLDGGDLRVMPAYLHSQDFHIAGIKSVTVHPQNASHGLPTVMAVIVLNDPGTGFPLAIMDGTYLTGMRTGAAGALAVKYLSRKDAKSAGFVGCGVQARSQLSCILEVRRLTKIKVWQFKGDEKSAWQFKDWVEKTYARDVMISADMDEVTNDVDILITSTPSRTPLVKSVSAGTHINAIGADAPGKQEISPKILKEAKVVVDDWTQASHSGEINVPYKASQITKSDICAELGKIVAGKALGRTSEEDITIFDATGLAIQDVSCAHAVYEVLKDTQEIIKLRLF
ncbi:MAG: hypothetical protein PHN75_03060 [Syntrophales bacterium]|nr:hypothetical protein [Syntrophales bacterium]